MFNKYDIIGKKYGRLTVVGYGHYVKNKHYYICHCDCGGYTLVRRSSLPSGNTKSCGCMYSGGLPTHGRAMSKSKKADPVYKTWDNMITRTTNPKHDSYKNYGGRGIRVCNEWRHSFRSFLDYVLETIGEKPEGMWIDRIDVNGDYEPGNIRWVTPLESAHNKRITGYAL